MARFGPDIALPDLLLELAQCERRRRVLGFSCRRNRRFAAFSGGMARRIGEGADPIGRGLGAASKLTGEDEISILAPRRRVSA